MKDIKFCKNCRYYEIDYKDDNRYCEATDNINYEINPEDFEKVYVERLEEKNKNNNCTSFKSLRFTFLGVREPTHCYSPFERWLIFISSIICLIILYCYIIK